MAQNQNKCDATSDQSGTYLYGFEEVTRVVEKHLFHAWVENNRRHWVLVARLGPPPAAMGVCKVYLHTMGLEDNSCLDHSGWRVFVFFFVAKGVIRSTGTRQTWGGGPGNSFKLPCPLPLGSA